MSGEPAIRKVLERLETWLTSNVGAGVNVHLDRPFDQSFRDEDLPYVNIRCDRTTFSVFNYGSMLHEAVVKFDIVSGAASSANINQSQAEIAAALTTRMWAMAPTSGTIGDLLQDKLPVSMGPEQDSFEMSDAGEATFTWALTYVTPLDDFRTILGASGLVT